ncbi:FecR domain-containing protein [Leptospira sp. 96542]|nr:FecR domain-containing protein [Leptospira sp. 96542]
MKIQHTLLFVAFFISIQSAHSEEFATASFIKGKVSFLSANDTSKLWKTLKVNDSLKPGDRVKTGNGSKVDFIYKESEFRIQQNTDFTLTEWDVSKSNSKIAVEKGAAWFRVKDFKKGNFTVSTPTTTAGVRGTAFGVFYEEKEKKGYTCVCEGLVNINGTDFSKGTGGAVALGKSELEKNEYKELITKEGATPKVKEKMKDFPMLAKCLPCHKPIGWKADGVMFDQKYGN